MLPFMLGLCARLSAFCVGGELLSFNEIVTSERTHAASVQSAIESAVAEVSDVSALYIVHAPKETSPLRISEDLSPLNQRREALESLLGRGIPLVVLHNPSEGADFYRENREKYSSLVDVVTNESLEPKSGATLFVSFPGMRGTFFYFEITASQIDAASPAAELSIKFGDSSDERTLDAARRRVALLENIPIEKSGDSMEVLSFSEFLASAGLAFPVMPEALLAEAAEAAFSTSQGR